MSSRVTSSPILTNRRLCECPAPEPPRPTNLPALLSELIGRDDELTEILHLAAAHRLVTLTGAGGIGKNAARARGIPWSLPQLADGVWLIEVARLSNPDLIPATVASAAGLELAASADSPEDLAEALSGKQRPYLGATPRRL
jgi:hypothetical protein